MQTDLMARPVTWLAVLVVLLAVSCTTTPVPEPSPTPSASVSVPAPDVDRPTPSVSAAVVVSPTPQLHAVAAEIAARRFGASLGDQGNVRVVAADGPEAMPDLVRFLAGEGHGLVCALGPGSLAAIRAVAADLPSTRFCATPVIASDVPDNVAAFDLRTEEAAYLAGVAAGAYAPDVAPVLITGPDAHAVARQQQAFRDGFASASSAEGIVPIVLGPVETAEEAVAAVEEHLVAGVSVVYTDAAAADAGVLAAAISENARRAEAREAPSEPAPSEAPVPPTDVVVIGGPDLQVIPEGEQVPREVAYVVATQWDQAVDTAVERLQGTWQGGIASLGLLEEALQFEEGPNTDLPEDVRIRVEDTRAGIIDGRVTIRPDT